MNIVDINPNIYINTLCENDLKTPIKDRGCCAGGGVGVTQLYVIYRNYSKYK